MGKFTLTAVDDIELKATGINGQIKLYNNKLTQIGNKSGSNSQIILNMTELPPGVYYANAEGIGAEIPLYNLKLTASFVAFPPAKPSTPSASDGTYSDRILISWSDISNATIYEVYRCTNTSVVSCGTKFSDTSSPYNDTSVAAGINFYYRIKGCNNIGCSEFSNSDIGFIKGLTNEKKGAILSIIQQLLMDDD